MFFENEVTRTLTLFEFLLVALIGLAPAAISIWMKPCSPEAVWLKTKKVRRRALTVSLATLLGGQACFLATLSRHSSEFASHGSSASFPRHSTGTNHLRPLW